MTDAHLDLIKLFVVECSNQYLSREEVQSYVPQGEVTRRIREVREAKWGSYNIRYDSKKGYIYVPDRLVELSESLRRRRCYLEDQAKL